MKFTLEEKLKIAKLHVDDGVPIYELSHQYDFSVCRIKYICTLYRRWGEKAFDKNTKRTTSITTVSIRIGTVFKLFCIQFLYLKIWLGIRVNLASLF